MKVYYLGTESLLPYLTNRKPLSSMLTSNRPVFTGAAHSVTPEFCHG
jgi:hypothetical protein